MLIIFIFLFIVSCNKGKEKNELADNEKIKLNFLIVPEEIIINNYKDTKKLQKLGDDLKEISKKYKGRSGMSEMSEEDKKALNFIEQKIIQIRVGRKRIVDNEKINNVFTNISKLEGEIVRKINRENVIFSFEFQGVKHETNENKDITYLGNIAILKNYYLVIPKLEKNDDRRKKDVVYVKAKISKKLFKTLESLME